MDSTFENQITFALQVKVNFWTVLIYYIFPPGISCPAIYKKRLCVGRLFPILLLWFDITPSNQTSGESSAIFDDSCHEFDDRSCALSEANFSQKFNLTKSDEFKNIPISLLSGTKLEVSGSSRADFLRQALAIRSAEFSESIRLVRKGLAQVVPISYITLFTPRELGDLVCGQVRGLKRNKAIQNTKLTRKSLPSH